MRFFGNFHEVFLFAVTVTERKIHRYPTEASKHRKLSAVLTASDVLEMLTVCHDHLTDAADVIFNGKHINILVLPMLIEVSCADIYSGSLEMRCDYRNVGKGAVVFRKAKAKNKVCKIGVVATVKYRIVTSAPIHLNDIIDLWLYFGSRKLVGSLTAAFLVLTEQHVTFVVAYKLKDHIDSATVIAADSLG